MRVYTLLALSCTTSRALLPPSSFAPAQRASLLQSKKNDNGRPEKREEVPIQSSVNPAGPLPVESWKPLFHDSRVVVSLK